MLQEALFHALSSSRPVEVPGQQLVELTEFLNPSLAVGKVWAVLKPDLHHPDRPCLATVLPDAVVQTLFSQYFSGQGLRAPLGELAKKPKRRQP